MSRPAAPGRQATPDLLVVPDDSAPADLLDRVRQLVVDAFDDGFTDDDWAHTCGGWRVVAMDDDEPVSHAAVVPRMLHVDDRPLSTGYVEGVATRRDRRGEGLGLLVMTRVGDLVRREHDLGALSTGHQGFYRRSGWEPWQGPTWVRVDGRLVRTPDEDDGVMVLRHGASAALDLTSSIVCEARAGDDW